MSLDDIFPLGKGGQPKAESSVKPAAPSSFEAAPPLVARVEVDARPTVETGMPERPVIEIVDRLVPDRLPEPEMAPDGPAMEIVRPRAVPVIAPRRLPAPSQRRTGQPSIAVPRSPGPSAYELVGLAAKRLQASAPVRSERLVTRGQRLLPGPGGGVMLRADYRRLGDDLVLVEAGLERFVARNYFATDTMPELVSPEGLRIGQDLVNGLTVSFGTDPAARGATMAEVGEVTGIVQVRRPGHGRESLPSGTQLAIGDLIEVGRGARLSLRFADGLRIELGSGSRLRLDGESRTEDGGRLVELSLLCGAFASLAPPIGMPPFVNLRTAAASLTWCDASVLGQIGLEAYPDLVVLLRSARAVAGQLTIVTAGGLTALSGSSQVQRLDGHQAPVDPTPLADSLLRVSAFGRLLPSRRAS